jgi:hypothetical protein
VCAGRSHTIQQPHSEKAPRKSVQFDAGSGEVTPCATWSWSMHAAPALMKSRLFQGELIGLITISGLQEREQTRVQAVLDRVAERVRARPGRSSSKQKTRCRIAPSTCRWAAYAGNSAVRLERAAFDPNGTRSRVSFHAGGGSRAIEPKPTTLSKPASLRRSRPNCQRRGRYCWDDSGANQVLTGIAPGLVWRFNNSRHN